MTKYYAYASMVALTMSRMEYYYGAARGQNYSANFITTLRKISQSYHNLPCKEQDTKREDDSIRWILRIIFSFFRNG